MRVSARAGHDYATMLRQARRDSNWSVADVERWWGRRETRIRLANHYMGGRREPSDAEWLEYAMLLSDAFDREG